MRNSLTSLVATYIIVVNNRILCAPQSQSLSPETFRVVLVGLSIGVLTLRGELWLHSTTFTGSTLVAIYPNCLCLTLRENFRSQHQISGSDNRGKSSKLLISHPTGRIFSLHSTTYPGVTLGANFLNCLCLTLRGNFSIHSTTFPGVTLAANLSSCSYLTLGENVRYTAPHIVWWHSWQIFQIVYASPYGGEFSTHSTTFQGVTLI